MSYEILIRRRAQKELAQLSRDDYRDGYRTTASGTLGPL